MDSTRPFLVAALSTRAAAVAAAGRCESPSRAAEKSCFDTERRKKTNSNRFQLQVRVWFITSGCLSCHYHREDAGKTFPLVTRASKSLMRNMEIKKTQTSRRRVRAAEEVVAVEEWISCGYWAVFLLKSRPDAMWQTDGALSRDSHRHIVQRCSDPAWWRFKVQDKLRPYTVIISTRPAPLLHTPLFVRPA